MVGKRKSTSKSSKTTLSKTTKSTQSKSRSKRLESLYNKLTKPKTNVKQLVIDWIEKYNEDAEIATLDVINLIVECGGADAMNMDVFQNTSFNKDSEDVSDTEDSKTYPLSTKRSKTLINNYREFFVQLVTKCQTSILYDKYLIDMIVLWSKKFSVSSSRGLRFSTVYACVHLASTILIVASELKRELNLTSRQLASEGSVGKSSERLKTLKENQLQLTNKLKHIEKLVKEKFYKMIFLPRVTDIQPEIRTLIIENLPNWILEYPSAMLTPDYLKHIGWALNDWVSEVRMNAIKGLIQLYSEEDYITQYDGFTQSFKFRIVDIAQSDKVEKICVEAIHLVSIMAKHSLLEDELLDRVLSNYKVDNELVVNATGKLLYQIMIEPFESKLNSLPKAERKGAKNEIREQELMKLIEFLEENAQTEVPFYLVNSLWSKSQEFLSDWSFYSKFLSDLEEKNIEEKKLIIILRIISSAVKISCGERLAIFSAQRQQLQNEDPTLQDDIIQDSDITSNFLSILPDLLSQYKSSHDVSICLVEIARYFNLETYISLRLQTKYSELLDILRIILLENPNEKLVETISNTLYCLSKGQPTQLESPFKMTIQEIYNQLTQSLKDLTTDSEGNGSGEDIEKQTDQLFNTYSLLQKINHIGTHFQPEDSTLQIALIPLMDGIIGTKPIDDQEYREKIITLSSQSYSQMIMWEITSLAPPTDSTTPESEPSENVYFMFYQFVHRMNVLLESKRSSNNLKHFAFKSLVEILLFFNPTLEKTVLDIYSLHVPKSFKLLESSLRVLFDIENEVVLDEIKNHLEREDEDDEESESEHEKRSTRNKRRQKTESEDEIEESDEDEKSKRMSDKEASDAEKEQHLSTNFSIAKDPIVIDPETQEKIEELVLSSLQAIQRKIIPLESNMGLIIKQVALSPGSRSIELIKEYIHFLSTRIKNINQESFLVFSTLKEFYLVCLAVEDDDLREHLFTRLKGLIDWLFVEFIKKDSLGSVFEISIKYFFGKDPENPEHPDFLRCISYLIPKLTHEQAVEIIKHKPEYDEDDEAFESLNNVYSMVEMIADKKVRNKLKKPSRKRKSKKSQQTSESDLPDEDIEDDFEMPEVEQEEEEEDEIEQDEFEPSQEVKTNPKKKTRY